MKALAAVLASVFLTGCASPAECESPCSSGAAVPVHDVEVQAIAVNDCPPNSTCAPIGGGAGGAEVVLDGELAGTADSWGRLTLLAVPEGQHAVCARHPDYGSSRTTTFWSGGAQETIRLDVQRDGPPCPGNQA